MTTAMNGAERILQALQEQGVRVCFTNPGTSEMQLVVALDQNPDVRPVLGLFEGVVTGAADGYGRMTDHPACTLLHLGPGLSNGSANLHNARRAGTPIVNLVGDHATYHRHLDAPLTSDIEGLARPVSHWVRTVGTSGELATSVRTAVVEAERPPGHIATLIVPADVAWSSAPAAGEALTPADPSPPDPDAVAASAEALRRAGDKGMLLLGDRALRADALEAAGRVAAATGCALASPTFNRRTERGAGRVPVQKLPYFPESVHERLDGIEELVLVGAQAPVGFFAYPDKPSWLTPAGCNLRTAASAGTDPVASLGALADALNAPASPFTQSLTRPDRPTGALTAESLAAAIGHTLPEGAIVVDEAITSGIFVSAATAGAPPHDWLDQAGGSIGFGPPAATGAAVACPDRPVINLQGDGSAMYTLQALWTQARENLNVTTVVFANRTYAVLHFEMMRTGAETIGERARSVLDIGDPTLDFVSLARGMGVAAERAETADRLVTLLEDSATRPGPFVIEAVL